MTKMIFKQFLYKHEFLIECFVPNNIFTFSLENYVPNKIFFRKFCPKQIFIENVVVIRFIKKKNSQTGFSIENSVPN